MLIRRKGFSKELEQDVIAVVRQKVKGKESARKNMRIKEKL